MSDDKTTDNRLGWFSVVGEWCWLALMGFKILTAAMMLGFYMFGGIDAKMPTPQQVWFAMMVAFYASGWQSIRRLERHYGVKTNV